METTVREMLRTIHERLYCAYSGVCYHLAERFQKTMGRLMKDIENARYQAPQAEPRLLQRLSAHRPPLKRRLSRQRISANVVL